MTSTDLPIQPFWGVLVRLDEQSSFIRGVHHTKAPPPSSGYVVAVGYDTPTLEVGDHIGFMHHSGTTYSVGEDTWKLLTLSEVLGWAPKGGGQNGTAD